MPLTANQTLILTKCIHDLPLGTTSLSAEYYYDSLPQCVIDAVYSIGVRYTSTRQTVINYCNHAGITRLSTPSSIPSDAHSIDDLLAKINSYPTIADCAAYLFENKQKTSTTNGILKAEAVKSFATVLKDNGIQTLHDIRTASPATIAKIESEIKNIPGQKSGISFSYFLMLSGDDSHMKIDRWLLRFVGDALGVANFNNVPQAYADLIAVCVELKKTYPHLTPRLLDHTIWSYMK